MPSATFRRKTTSPFHSFAVIVRFFTSVLHERELGQLVVVRGEEDPRNALPVAASAVVEALGDGPRQREAVERGGATADLVEDDEASRASRAGGCAPSRPSRRGRSTRPGRASPTRRRA